PMQLILDFTTKPALQRKPVIENKTWLDVSDLACGVGFTSTVQISVTLHDALEPLQNEIDGDYDQRLYDALWRPHFQLSLNSLPSATFNFNFPHKDWKTEKISEISLRLRVEAQEQVVLLGLSKDF